MAKTVIRDCREVVSPAQPSCQERPLNTPRTACNTSTILSRGGQRQVDEQAIGMRRCE